ncbi:MAG: response regulator [Proteobacteria bacterium]|nr:response regulator [Pseudomonadota bacterium]
MTLFEKLKPKFWDYQDVAAGPYKHLFNFRRIWNLAVVLISLVALIPLISITLIDYGVTQHSVESEVLLRTSRLVSNTWRTVSFFLAQRRSALDFVIRDNSYNSLHDPKRLSAILGNLKQGFGGFVDLGVIDSTGRQRNYAGPYKLEGIDYSDQEWFKEVTEKGVNISDVFMGFRRTPHIVIAVRHDFPDDSFYILRATIDTDKFNELLAHLEVSGQGDSFLINKDGILQTPSRDSGNVLDRIPLPVPDFSPKTRVYEGKAPDNKQLVIGYAYIHDTPFILMIVKQKNELMKPWRKTHFQLIGFLIASITIIVVVVLGVATYLVNRILIADQKRIMTLHEVEYSNKMASIGRLAAGVAHEINNPLAVINEKVGLIKDLFTIKEEFKGNRKLIELVDSALSSVDRCGTITKRLLNFARHMDVKIQMVDIGQVIGDVLGFLSKEAEYRSIAISVNVPGDIPQFESDRGKLQQVFLNIVNNAFAAVKDGGKFDITVKYEGADLISVTFTDDGCGISESDLNRIYEPFFSTKTRQGGTGLGLSITYGLVQELGGSIGVQSEVGRGTRFVVTIPLKMRRRRKKPMKVLLVDDEKELVSTLAERLSLRDIEADWVTTGAAAIKNVESKSYDIAVLDVKMPKISGIELKKKLEEINPVLKYIFMTGHGSEEDFMTASNELGAEYYLVKPVNIDDLIRKMKEILINPDKRDK